MFGVVYKITCTKNNKVYIGQTVQYEKRVKQHLSMLYKNCHTNKNLQLDYNLYGSSCFKFNILCKCTTREEMIDKETYYINMFGGIESSKTYNMMDKYNENWQVKQSIGKAHKGMCHTEDTKSNISQIKNDFYNSSDGDKCKKQISETLKQFYDTEKGIELKNNLHNFQVEYQKKHGNPMLGRKHTEESKRLMSEKRKGRPGWNKGKRRIV